MIPYIPSGKYINSMGSVDVFPVSQNITSTYSSFYIKSGTYISALILTIQANENMGMGQYEQIECYVQYTSGMTWAELCAHDTLKYALNSRDDNIGTMILNSTGVLYTDANHATSGRPSPTAADRFVRGEDVIGSIVYVYGEIKGEPFYLRTAV